MKRTLAARRLSSLRALLGIYAIFWLGSSLVKGHMLGVAASLTVLTGVAGVSAWNMAAQKKATRTGLGC